MHIVDAQRLEDERASRVPSQWYLATEEIDERPVRVRVQDIVGGLLVEDGEQLIVVTRRRGPLKSNRVP